jgi:hypothetical protein
LPFAMFAIHGEELLLEGPSSPSISHNS